MCNLSIKNELASTLKNIELLKLTGKPFINIVTISKKQ